ncbi:MAG: hypothetical protein L6461_07440 [Anaerolineae bacterium]|nr:hypothetical protein [Anaerolineae bacterium]
MERELDRTCFIPSTPLKGWDHFLNYQTCRIEHGILNRHLNSFYNEYSLATSIDRGVFVSATWGRLCLKIVSALNSHGVRLRGDDDFRLTLASKKYAFMALYQTRKTAHSERFFLFGCVDLESVPINLSHQGGHVCRHTFEALALVSRKKF